MPTIHWQPMQLTGGEKGCGGCHKIGLKTSEEIEKLKQEGLHSDIHHVMHVIQDIHFL
jgi:hypothetical protein